MIFRSRVSLATTMIATMLLAGLVAAQDIQKGVTYVCNGERLYIENCNIRDTSDTSTCMVGHPDTILPNGLMKYTYETRGALKKLLPTCKQPTAAEMEKAKAFEKKQNDAYEANVKKAEQQQNSPTQAQVREALAGGKPKSPEERALNRCITSGRLPASCTGNTLLGAFSNMVAQVLPDAAKEAPPGPIMAGAFEGAGGWRIDFIDNGVLVNCADLAPDQHNYKLEFKGQYPSLIIDTTPKPLVLEVRPDGLITGPGPFTFDGVIVSGYVTTPPSAPGAVSKDVYGNKYDALGNRVYETPGSSYATFSHKRVTCPALTLSSKGARVGVQTMQTDLLKTMVSGDKGPPTPPGIRMTGIFANASGFSVQFFPESAILGCGPDAARAYPYTVTAEGAKALVRIAAPDHPLAFSYGAEGTLDPGSAGPYQVHGRSIVGQNGDGDFTFIPMEQTCNLSLLTASKTIPSSGGTAAAAATASAGNAGATAANGGGTISMPNAPLGNAVLTIVSGFPQQPNAANPLGNYPYVLNRDSFANTVAQAGVQVAAGTPPLKTYAMACQSRSPDCQKIGQAWKAEAISAARGDATGKAILPGVPPGTYYMMISIRYNNQPIFWDVKVQLNAGSNTLTLDPKNAVELK
jgi:hypothetical protein